MAKSKVISEEKSVNNSIEKTLEKVDELILDVQTHKDYGSMQDVMPNGNEEQCE